MLRGGDEAAPDAGAGRASEAVQAPFVTIGGGARGRERSPERDEGHAARRVGVRGARAEVCPVCTTSA